MNKTIKRIYSNIKVNQNLSKDILTIYHHAAQIKSPILLDTSPNKEEQDYIEQTIRDISEELSVPCVKVNAPEYTVEKMPGRHLSEILIQLLDASGDNMESARKGVVILDDIDVLYKLAEERTGTILNVELPKLIHGNVYEIVYNGQKRSFDTSNVTFIGKGNFSNANSLRTRSGYDKNGSRYLGGFQEIINAKNLELIENDTISIKKKPKAKIFEKKSNL